MIFKKHYTSLYRKLSEMYIKKAKKVNFLANFDIYYSYLYTIMHILKVIISSIILRNTPAMEQILRYIRW